MLSAAYENQSLKNWTKSTFYMHASFVNLLQDHCLSAKSWLASIQHQKRLNIKSTITMAITMTSCTTATLVAKGMQQILHLQHRDFHMRFCRKFLRTDGEYDPQ